MPEEYEMGSLPPRDPPALSFSLGPVLPVVSPSSFLSFPSRPLLPFRRSRYRAHIRSCTTVKPRSSGDCRTEAEICPYFGTGRFPVFTMAQWAHLSSAARLPCRRFIPRRSPPPPPPRPSRCSFGDTFRNAHNLSSL